MLELHDLVKHYPAVGGEPVRAVDGVTPHVRPGEMVALCGPSGSGKTTLLLMVAMLLKPSAGKVVIDGRDVSRLTERQASHFRLSELGFICQNFDLPPGVSAIDNAVLKLLKTVRWRDALRQMTPLLGRLGLGERLAHRAETPSMGERQRVMIARALSTKPSLLLADEPPGSLDSQRSREVLELLRELCRERNVAIVLVSHRPAGCGLHRSRVRGMLATVVAVLSPLRDIVARDPLAAITVKGGSGTGRGNLASTLTGALCLAGATAILFAAPRLAIVGMILLIAALLLVLPLVLDVALTLLSRLARTLTGAVPHVAAMELSAARARAIGVAATGAIAVFGAVAIQGAHADLLNGLENAARDENAFTDAWVSPPGTYNLLRTAPFAATEQARLEALSGVRAVRVYRGGLLDWAERKVWVIAPPVQAMPLLAPSQILEGSLSQAAARVRAGGWLVLSQALASEHHLQIGSRVTLPTPVPTTFRVAALSTNIGWAPGAITMSAAGYAQAWGNTDASAYNILLDAGVSDARAAGEITRALGPASGLSVQSAQAHADEQNALSRQGLQRLSEIATLILVVAVLAMAAAIGNMVWQRRPRLAKLKLEGFPRAELWSTILVESLLLLAVGCLTGAIFGLYGQQLLDRALANVVNFPVVYSVALLSAIVSLAVVTAAALLIIVIPGYLAAGVPPTVALQD